MPQNRDHAGELLPNGFHVGDYVTYTRTGDPRGGERSGYVTYHQNAEEVWATFDESEGNSRSRFERGELGSYLRPASRATLIRRHDGSSPWATTTEGSTTMTAEVQGTWEPITEGIPAGSRFRFYHETDPIVEENFAYEGTMIDWSERRWTLDVAGTYGRYEVGNDLTLDCHDYQLGSYRVWTPALGVAEVQEEAYDGTKGAFFPHTGEAPEPGTIVRGMVPGTTRQVEGLFLRLDDGAAVVERKRKRNKKADGTFGDWDTYANVGRANLSIEGAEVFKPGASKPAEPTLVRGTPLTDAATSNEVDYGNIISAREKYGSENTAYRGVVVRRYNQHGEYIVNVTEKARLASGTQANGVYKWEPMEPREMHLIAQWSDGSRGYDRAGWTWAQLMPGVKPVDPAYDPKRKTPYTGMGIGDVVVGLMRERDGSRDTVASWVRGEIVKWNVRYGRPVVRVSDKMESNKAVGDEVELVAEDTYPAMADPASVSPEEYKKTLRLYLIGRHKRGDFCRGGLNTMLAAHGIPLYETRRRAQLLVTVDYDPNETDLYTVQTELRSKLAHVSGLSFHEQSGEDIELTLESDTTQG
jgi:hypothetical protein